MSITKCLPHVVKLSVSVCTYGASQKEAAVPKHV